MLAYSNPEHGEGINVHVGGDAYNYIINANQATGFFIIALIFAVVGSTSLIVNTIKTHK